MDEMERSITGVFRAIFSSRKSILFIFVVLLIGFVAFGFSVIILRSAWRGEMQIKDAMTMVFATMMAAVVGSVVMGNTVINAIKDEKVAKMTADATPTTPKVQLPMQIATGDATITNVTEPEPSKEVITDPQTPHAKDRASDPR